MDLSPPPVRPYPLCLCTGSLSLPCGHLLVTQRIVTQFVTGVNIVRHLFVTGGLSVTSWELVCQTFVTNHFATY